MSDDERPTLRAPRISRAQQEQFDLEKLWLMPEFKRFLFTLFELGPMFSGIYGDEGRHLAFGEGRRSLGYDTLRKVEAIDPAALALILAEEYKSRKEAPRGQRPYDRHRELGADERRSGDDPPDDA